MSPGRRTVSLSDLPQDLLSYILAVGGASMCTFKGALTLREILPDDPSLARLWFAARNVRALPGAAGRGWWGIVVYLLSDASPVYSRDFGPVLVAAAHAGAHKVVSSLLSKPTTEQGTGYSSKRLFVQVQSVTSRLSVSRYSVHLEMHRMSRVWAVYIAVLESVRQGNEMLVKMLMPEMLNYDTSSHVCECEWRGYLSSNRVLSEIAASSGNLLILDMLWEHGWIDLCCVLETASRSGHPDVWFWCLRQHAQYDSVGYHRLLECAVLALVNGHTKLVVVILRALPNGDSYFVSAVKRHTAREEHGLSLSKVCKMFGWAISEASGGDKHRFERILFDMQGLCDDTA